MRIRIREGTLFFIFWMILLIIQSPLERVSSLFNYLDEVTALLGIVTTILYFRKFSTLNAIYYEKMVIILLSLFVAIGLLANLIYNYQPLSYVVQDLFVNEKFFLSVMLGFFIFQKEIVNKDRKQISSVMRVVSQIFLVLFLIDRATSLFGYSEVRYGIRSFKLNYQHETYLAAALAGLICLLIIFYEKKNLKYIVIDTIMMAFTLRSKSFGAAIALIMIAYVVFIHNGRFRVWQLLILALLGLLVGWSQFSFYFVDLAGKSARSKMLTTSISIMKDYFPIGTGFATYASHMAGAHYSPVYIKYGFQYIYELRNSSQGTFFDDQFWPIIFGQTGAIGTVAYIGILIVYFRRISTIRSQNKYVYCGSLFAFIYLLISSIAEPAFNNSVACLFGVVLGVVFKQYCSGSINIRGNAYE